MSKQTKTTSKQTKRPPEPTSLVAEVCDIFPREMVFSALSTDRKKTRIKDRRMPSISLALAEYKALKAGTMAAASVKSKILRISPYAEQSLLKRKLAWASNQIQWWGSWPMLSACVYYTTDDSSVVTELRIVVTCKDPDMVSDIVSSFPQFVYNFNGVAARIIYGELRDFGYTMREVRSLGSLFTSSIELF